MLALKADFGDDSKTVFFIFAVLNLLVDFRSNQQSIKKQQYRLTEPILKINEYIIFLYK